MNVIVPSVSINGTSREALIDGLRDAMLALMAAETALENAAPNARDYRDFAPARTHHIARVRRIREVRAEIAAIAEKLEG